MEATAAVHTPASPSCSTIGRYSDSAATAYLFRHDITTGKQLENNNKNNNDNKQTNKLQRKYVPQPL
jgi:hypothetical protein